MGNKPSRFRRKARTTPVTLAVDPDDAPAIVEAQTNVAEAKAALDRLGRDATAGDRTRATEAVTDAEKALVDVLATRPTVTLTLQAVSPAAREGLMADHPPTDTEQAAYDKASKPETAPALLSFSPDGYYPALLAMSVTRVVFSDDPDSPLDTLTTEEAEELWATASEGDRIALQAATQMLVIASSRVEALGKG